VSRFPGSVLFVARLASVPLVLLPFPYSDFNVSTEFKFVQIYFNFFSSKFFMVQSVQLMAITAPQELEVNQCLETLASLP